MNAIVLLPECEHFSPNKGGALSTWVYSVYGQSIINLYLYPCIISPPSKPEMYRDFFVIEVLSSSMTRFLSKVIKNRSFKGILNPFQIWLKGSYNRKAFELSKPLKADIIHIHNDYEAVFPARRLNPHSRIILHMNNDHLTGNDYLVSTDYLIRAETACHIADKIVFCSDYIRRKALKTFPSILPDKTGVIFNGVELSFLASSARSLGNDFRLLFVGRIVPQKGLHLLIEAIDNVFCHFPQATLRIVGGINFGSSEEDEYLKTLKRKSEHWGDRIVWVGPVPHDQIMLEFQQADLFICPSIWNEPLGMVNAEAMACGLPIVAFAKGGIPEILGDAGILVEETTPEALAQAINQVLGDSELYQTLSQRGLQRVKEKFNWNVIANKWLNELQELYTQKQDKSV